MSFKDLTNQKSSKPATQPATPQKQAAAPAAKPKPGKKH